jgi:mannose-6-phosphate isomerase-like protein (cupin superfamily)
MAERPSSAIDLSAAVVHLRRDGSATAKVSPPGPPERIDGYSIGAPVLSQEPPHDGEMHPDGDEILFLVSGSVTVVLEDSEPAREVSLRPGQAIIVPRGVWHRVRLNQPSQVVHVTPGPGGDHRAKT